MSVTVNGETVSGRRAAIILALLGLPASRVEGLSHGIIGFHVSGSDVTPAVEERFPKLRIVRVEDRVASAS